MERHASTPTIKIYELDSCSRRLASATHDLMKQLLTAKSVLHLDETYSQILRVPMESQRNPTPIT